MTVADLSRLLDECESNVLDFKRDNYPFSGATDEQKSELLKDLLGFANATRRIEAFILLGVKEMPGGRAEVIGIDEHLDDHSLQQFVQSKVNRELLFGYETVLVEGKQVGVLRVPMQERPVYLKHDYGKLKKERVYVRRGSSTDPSKPADPDEIARMALGSFQELRAPRFQLTFGDADDSIVVGDTLTLEVEAVSAPDNSMIPTYEDAVHEVSLGMQRIFMPQILDPLNRKNPEFYREIARYSEFVLSHRKVRVVAQNLAEVAAEQVLLVVELGAQASLLLADEGDTPDEPLQVSDLVYRAARNFARPKQRGDVIVTRAPAGTSLKIEFGSIQPGRSVWSEPFWISAVCSGQHSFEAEFFAANLPKPQRVTLQIEATVTPRVVTADDIYHFADKIENSNEQDDD